MRNKTNKFDKLGVLLCSSNTLYNISTVKTFMDYMVKLGYNTLYLEISKGYEIEEEPFFAYMSAKYSKSEMKELDAYAVSKGIQIIPVIQTFAHLKQIFQWIVYRDIEDCDGILLVGHPRVYQLIENMIKTMKECFSSGIIHLGMDEAFTLGRGKYYDLHGPVERTDIMFEHVNKVLEIVNKYDMQPEMWGDMYLRFAYGDYEKGSFTFDKSAEVSKTIPQNLKIHYWDYYGLEKERYLNYIERFKKLTDNIVFDGGVWNYLGFNPDNTYSIKATKAAFIACEEQGIKEATITLWGGNGAECSLWTTMPTLVAASEFAKGNYDVEKIKKKFYQLMGMSFDDFIALEYADKVKTENNCNPEGYLLDPTKYLLYNDLFCGFLDSTVFEDEKERFSKAARLIEKACKNKRWGYIFKLTKSVAELTELKFDLGLRLRRAYRAGDKTALRQMAEYDCTEIVKRIKKLYQCLKVQWIKENKQHGFDVHDIRFGGNIQRILHCKEMLISYCNGELDKLEELEEELICYRGGGKDFRRGGTTFNNWRQVVTVNVL